MPASSFVRGGGLAAIAAALPLVAPAVAGAATVPTEPAATYCSTTELTPDQIAAGEHSTITCYTSLDSSLRAVGIDTPKGASLEGLATTMAASGSGVAAIHYKNASGAGEYLTVAGDGCDGGGLSFEAGESWNDSIVATRHRLCSQVKHYSDANYGGTIQTTVGGNGALQHAERGAQPPGQLHPLPRIDEPVTATFHPDSDTATRSFDEFVLELGELLGRRCDGATPTSRLTEDLGFDSVDRLELLGLFDREGIDVPDELVATLATVGDLHHFLTTIEPRGSGTDVAAASTPGPVATPLESASLVLRPVTAADEPYLFRLLTTGEQLVRYRLRGMTPSPEAFHQFIWDRVVAQFVAITHQGQPVGLVSCFDPDFRNRYAYVAAVADPAVQGNGLMAEATHLFVRYLFGEFDLRKLYAESLEPNYEQFAHGAGKLFEVEGRLRDHEYLGGRYVDALLLAAHRDQWVMD